MAEQLVHFAPEDRPGSRVRCHDRAFAVLDYDAFGEVLHDIAVELGALAQGLEEAFALGDILENRREIR